MRYGCAALLMLLSSAVTAPAQGVPTVPAAKVEPRLSPDDVVARLLFFDRNRDGKVATDELSERMHGLVARGDRGGDAALDAAEIRSLATPSQQFATGRSGGSYGFGDTGVLSSRTHIENTIDDLGLAPGVNTEAKRIASAFVDELEGTAFANFRNAVAPILTEAQLADFEADLKRGAGVRTIQLTPANGSQTQTFVIRADPGRVFRHHLSADHMKVAAAAVEKFRVEQLFDDARRSALVGQLHAVLTDEERDNFRAALARRPLVKGPGVFGGNIGGIVGRAEVLNLQLRNVAEIVTTPRP